MYTRPDIDLILLDDASLQIRFILSRQESLNIKGEDAVRFYDFLERGRDGDIVSESGGYMEMARNYNLLVEEKPAGGSSLPRCFIPTIIRENLYGLRVDSKIFLFEAATPEEVLEKTERVAKACAAQEDRTVFVKLLGNPQALRISAAPLQVSFTKENSACAGKINEYLLLTDNGVQPCREAEKLHQELADPYWGKIVDYALRNQIVAGLKFAPLKLQGLKETRVQAGYISSYLQQTLTDADHSFCWGAGATAAEAAGKSCAEALERYYSQQPIAGVLASQAVLVAKKARFAPLQNFIHLLPQQRETLGVPHTDFADVEIPWSAVQDSDGGECLVPSWMCGYGFHGGGLAKIFSSISTSNGCAAHGSAQEAFMAGASECMERDAILVWWYNRLAPPIVDEVHLPENIHRFLRESCVQDYEIRALDLTLDGLPVALLVARHRSKGWPYFFCGAGCAETYDEAVQKAFSEFYKTFVEHYGQDKKVFVTAADIKSPTDHYNYYADPANGGALDFLFQGHVIAKRKDPALAWADLQKKFGPLYTGVLKECALGQGQKLYITKTIIPGLVPITFGYMDDQLAHPRIYDLPVALGLRASPITQEEVLALYQPHFFP